MTPYWSETGRARFADRSAADLPHSAAVSRAGAASVGPGGVVSVARDPESVLDCRASRLTPDEAASVIAGQTAAAGAWRVVFDAAADVRAADRLVVTGQRLGDHGPPFTVTLDVVAVDDVRASLASLQVTAVEPVGDDPLSEAA